MKRLDFLKSLFTKGLLVSLPLGISAVDKKLSQVLIYRHHIAGFKYGEGMKVLSKMKEGDELHLVREPENIHDDQAVAVYWNQYRIGYVPAADNEMPNHFLLQGLPLMARIDKLTKTGKPWQVCEAGIYLLYPKEMIRKKGGSSVLEKV